MSVIKKIPKTDTDRKTVLITAKARKDASGEEGNIFTVKNSDKIDELEPIFKATLLEVEALEKIFHDKVGDTAGKFAALKGKSTHGLQLVVFKVLDKDTGFTPGVLSYYGLPLTGKLDERRTEDQIIDWGQHFIDGETTRVANGGTLLQDIKKVDVQTMLNAAVAGRAARQDDSDAVQAKQHELDVIRDAVDILIPSMYRDIDHAAKELPEGDQHGFCVKWGMLFQQVKGYAYVNVRTEDIDSHAILTGVDLRIGSINGKGGAKAKTNEMGWALMESRNFKPTNLNGTLSLYLPSSVEITLVEGQTIDVVLKLKKKPVVS